MPANSQFRTLSEHAHARIRDDILSGALSPDTKLRIEVLRRDYEMGASPLREALNRLAAEGLVLALSQRGFRVAPVSIEELRDITRLRVLLENEALAESIRHGDDAWEAGVVASWHRLSKLDQNRRAHHADWELANQQFHAALIAACRSPLLLGYRGNIYDRHKRYRALSLLLPGSSRSVEAEHKALFEAVMARDVAAACLATEQHIRRTAEETEAALQRRASTGSHSSLSA